MTIISSIITTFLALPNHADVEVDPTAYVLDGGSLHVGIGRDHLRVDLGVFAMSVPSFVTGQDAFDVAFAGAGAKLHYFLRSNQTGLFGGVGVGLARVDVQLRGSELAQTDLQLNTGLEIGYRFALPAGLYATPWLGVGYAWGADDVMLGDKMYAPTRVTVFPAVHIGYQFR